LADVESVRFDDLSDLDLLLFRQESVMSMSQALAHFSESTIRHRVNSGRWQRPFRSVLVTHSGRIGPDQWMWVAVLACGSRAVLSGTSSLAAAGARVASAAIHVLVDTAHRPRRAPGGVVVHRTSTLPDSHVHRMTMPPRTRPARAVVDAAQWANSDDAARVAIADAFQRRLVAADEVAHVLEVMPRARRRFLVMQTAADCAGGSDSIAELDYLRLGRRAGLPDPTRQVARTDEHGRRRYLDAVYEPWGVHVEIDGGQHTDAKAWWADMKRQNAVWIAGSRILRFPAWAIRERPNEVFAQVRAALITAGWTG
jgi:hypothetical protein